MCRASVEALDQVCSFTSCPASDYLDLDWAPSMLEQALRIAGVHPSLVDAVIRSTCGATEVNPAYRDWPDTVWEHPVTAHGEQEVANIAASLADVEAMNVFSDHRMLDLSLVAGTAGLEHPHQYLAEHLSALVTFYKRAAGQKFAVIMWWD
jgi:hypothetical protein